MAVRIFITGGTFDKEYDMINGKLYFEDTHLPEMLVQGRCTAEVHVRTLMMIDSLEMKEEDRKVIVHNCNKAEEKDIIITHGTDTMVKTAEVLANAKLDKTIVLTGALIPYKFGSSDGYFNIGCALGFVQSLNKGVYVVMNGQAFKWNNVTKNRKTGYFEAVK